MPKPEQTAARVFLTAVKQQLRGLEFAEQREILDELAAHLADATSLLEQEGLDSAEAVARAVASMGNPEMIGRQLRDEHLRRRLSLRDTVLALLPLLGIVWIFSHDSILQTVRNAGSAPNNGVGDVVGALIPVLVIALLGLWRSKQVWPATLLGGAGVFGLIAAHRLIGVTSHSTTSLIWFALAGLAVVPLALAFTLRYSSLHASLAILSGVMSYALLAWFLPEDPLSAAALVAIPVIGIVAVCRVSRRWQAPTIWAALIADWLLIVFYPVTIFNHTGAASLPALDPLSLGHSMQMISLPVLAGSGILLLSVKATARFQRCSRFEWLTRLAS